MGAHPINLAPCFAQAEGRSLVLFNFLVRYVVKRVLNSDVEREKVGKPLRGHYFILRFVVFSFLIVRVDGAESNRFFFRADGPSAHPTQPRSDPGRTFESFFRNNIEQVEIPLNCKSLL